ncbi:hypothetical protein [Bacillus mycoides]|uniref:hypothetical protein n=1 Tax=Bacillus mycoides TaxID=1405 RepID=UPI00355777C2
MTKLLENKEQPPKDYILDEKTKVDKQKINEFIKKNDKDGGVIALDGVQTHAYQAKILRHPHNENFTFYSYL